MDSGKLTVKNVEIADSGRNGEDTVMNGRLEEELDRRRGYGTSEPEGKNVNGGSEAGVERYQCRYADEIQQNDVDESLLSSECQCSEERKANARDRARRSEENARIELLRILRSVPKKMEKLPKGFEEWSFREMQAWIRESGAEELKLPKSLIYLLPAVTRPGDCGRCHLEKPDWFDAELCYRGQKFAIDNFSLLCFANLLALCLIFSDKAGLPPLILTGQSGTPYLAFKRYLSTLRRIRTWYTTDLFDEGSPAYKNLRVVRRMHLAVRERLCRMSQAEVREATKIEDPWSSIRETFLQDVNCSYIAYRGSSNEWKDFDYRPPGLNQADMSVTQFAFVGFILAYPAAFGIHRATETDLEAFCHCWRAIGYLLGIEDQYNFCRGTLDEIRERASDLIETEMKPNLLTIGPEWEHMTRCLVEGTSYYVHSPSYEIVLLYLTDLLEIPMPRVMASIDYFARLRFLLFKFFFHYIIKIPGVLARMNAMIHKQIDRALRFGAKKHSLLEEKSTKKLLDFTVG